MMPGNECPHDARVTVIVPCFNYGHFIAASLESVAHQTYRHWECIVVDDGSTDDTKEIVAGFMAVDERFRYLYQPNKGMSAARNAGMREASGAYLQFLDADDLLERRKIEAQVGFLEENPDVDIVYGDARYFPSGEPERRYAAIDGKSRSPIKKISGGKEELLGYLLVDNIMVMSAPLLRRKILDTCGYFDEGLRALEDWEYWLRCVNSGARFGYLEGDEALTLIRYHPGSVSKNKLLMLRANVEIRNRIHASLKEKRLESLNRNGIVNARIALAIEAMRHGNKLQGFGEVVRLSLLNVKLGSLLQGVKTLLLGK